MEALFTSGISLQTTFMTFSGTTLGITSGTTQGTTSRITLGNNLGTNEKTILGTTLGTVIGCSHSKYHFHVKQAPYHKSAEGSPPPCPQIPRTPNTMNKLTVNKPAVRFTDMNKILQLITFV